MVKKIIALILCYLVFVIFLGFFQASSMSLFDMGQLYHISKDIETSKKRGAFIQDLSITPQIIEINSMSVEIDKIWLEYPLDVAFVIELVPFIIEIPIWKRIDGYTIVFISKKAEDAFSFQRNTIFTIEKEGLKSARGLGVMNGKLRGSFNVYDLNWEKIKVAILDEHNWNLILKKDIIIKRVKPRVRF